MDRTSEENMDLEDETPEEPKGKKVAKHDSGAADLEKVTDYVEEAEISSQNFGAVSDNVLISSNIAHSRHAASVKMSMAQLVEC